MNPTATEADATVYRCPREKSLNAHQCLEFRLFWRLINGHVKQRLSGNCRHFKGNGESGRVICIFGKYRCTIKGPAVTFQTLDSKCCPVDVSEPLETQQLINAGDFIGVTLTEITFLFGGVEEVHFEFLDQC